MDATYSTAVIQDRLQALTRAIDKGSAAGKLLILDGTRPSTKGAAITDQNVLATQLFAKPSAGSVSGNTLTLAIGASVLASKTGKATWARIVDSDGTFVADLGVSKSGGSGALQLSTSESPPVPTDQLYEGGVFTLSLGTLVEA